jgi:disulfide bond formation protein DsbB
MCIYQRTAVFGILISATVPLIINHSATRLIGFVGWGISSVWGWMIASEHVSIQTAINPFFASCEIVPNFPSFMPLHTWLPSVFGATGSCGDINWQFMGLSMPDWMVIIFSIYTMLFFTVVLLHYSFKKKNRS